MTSGVLLLAFAGSLANRLTRFRAQEAQLRASRHQAQITEVTTTVIAAERSAFARDIHDTVSHAVGLIALQAGAAQVLAPEDPGAARDALTIVETTARAALRELDEQGVPVTDRAAERWDVERLVARIRASGHDVVLTFENDLPAPLSPLVYRVTQEGLINVVRHAPGAPARVDIRSDDTGVTISVTNKASGQPSRGRHSGYGLIGLRERLAFAGGTLRAAPTKEGFELIAQLPPSVAADQDVKS
jgi:signal transduction histidine kinase